jgi:4-hydroxy-3-methylbut-2-enyl diphosphate reductase
MTDLPPLTLYLAAPRGFCAGVDRAIKIVEMAIEKWGAPVFVRHEIVHNRYVVEDLRAKGAVFVEELDDCPDDRPVIFSAHGVPKSVPAAAQARQMIAVDATCPLVTKVHNEAQRHSENGLQMVMIGHAGHPETVGTMGQLPPGEVLLVETAEDVATLTVRDPGKLAYITQTTLSIDDTKGIIVALKKHFSDIVGPETSDICYATQNRQTSVRELAKLADVILVVGAANSSNSNRLREIGIEEGIPSYLINDGSELKPEWVKGKKVVGLTAGASAPEELVRHVIEVLGEIEEVQVETMDGKKEYIEFRLPAELRA